MFLTGDMEKINDALILIRDKYGLGALDDSPRLRALLSDFAPMYRREGRIFANVVDDKELIHIISLNQGMSLNEAIKAIEERTGLKKQWTNDVAICLFNFLGREIIQADDDLNFEEVPGVRTNNIQNPLSFFHSISSAVECVVKQADTFEKTNDLDKICNVLNGEKGQLVADALKHGAPVYVKEGIITYTEIEVTRGIQFDRGYLSPYFATSEDSSLAILEYPLVLLMEEKINSIQEIPAFA